MFSEYQFSWDIFTRVHATLHPALSVRPSVRPSVRLSVRYACAKTAVFGRFGYDEILH